MRSITTGLSLLVATAALPAQTPPCLNLNDATTATSGSITPFGFGGPNMRGWQIMPATPLVVRSGRLFTGTTFSSPRFLSLEIWSDSGAALPGTRLGGGSWSLVRPQAWQGCNFDQVITLQANTPYWLVWIDPGAVDLPVEPGGTVTNTAWFSGGAWGAISSEAPKYRLYCTLLDDQGVIPFGNLCATSGGTIGSAFTNQAPMVGNTAFAVEGTGLPTGAFTFLLAGVNPAFASIPVGGLPAGCAQNTDVVWTVSGSTGTGTVRGPTVAGHVAFGIPIPASMSLAGTYLGTQLASIDLASGAVLPFSTTNALRLTVF